MAVVKKRRSHHAKSSRAHQIQLQQQQQLQAKQRFENSRLRPEHMSTVAHDESDTISYRSYLLKQYIKSAELIDVLTTQLIPLDKIRPPTIYPSTLSEMEQRLEAQKVSLARTKEITDAYEWQLGENSQFLKDKLRLSENGLEEPDAILEEYKAKFGLRSRDNSVVIHRDKFLSLKGDSAEAPHDYWQSHAQAKQKQADRERKKQQEEQEAKRRLQEEQELRRQTAKEEEIRKQTLEEQHRQQREQQQQQQQQQSQAQAQAQEQQQAQSQAQEQKGSDDIEQQQQEEQTLQDQEQAVQEQAHLELSPPSPHSQQEEQHQQPQQQQQQQPPNPNMMDSIFGEFGNEPFNNGFEDEFGDIDTAFF
ncbi:uncharacterized protein ZBAI_09551 [Zygosaccharomyces bailii ISA1307]|nr:uncharacterized protein ZBAI_09551 [Zygosaccharomyces bailii ISA1307]